MNRRFREVGIKANDSTRRITCVEANDSDEKGNRLLIVFKSGTEFRLKPNMLEVIPNVDNSLNDRASKERIAEVHKSIISHKIANDLIHSGESDFEVGGFKVKIRAKDRGFERRIVYLKFDYYEDENVQIIDEYNFNIDGRKINKTDFSVCLKPLFKALCPITTEEYVDKYEEAGILEFVLSLMNQVG